MIQTRTAFAGMEGGKPFSQIAGSILEFALGMGLAGVILIAGGVK